MNNFPATDNPFGFQWFERGLGGYGSPARPWLSETTG